MPNPTLCVAAGQWSPGDDVASNRWLACELVAEAALLGAELVVLPEYSQFFTIDMEGQAAAAAEALDGPFVTALQAVAKEHGVAVLAGMLEKTEGRPFNTVIALDQDGELAGAYRKVHLFDAFGTRESDWLGAGDPGQAVVLDVGAFTVGVQTCYDLRFPEISRRLIDAGATVLAIPAEWLRGPLKEHHWRTLATARAIENQVFVIAADQAPPIGAGSSMVIDPMGVALASLGEERGVALARIAPERIDQVRGVNPALDNRRYRIADPV